MLKQVSDTKPASQRPVSVHVDSTGKQAREESTGKEKSPSQQAAAQDRIRAKLIEISEQSVPDVKLSQRTHSRDIRISSRHRSPSPKRPSHVCIKLETLLVQFNCVITRHVAQQLNCTGRLSSSM